MLLVQITTIAQELILIKDALPYQLAKTCAVYNNDALTTFGGQIGPNSVYDITPNASSIIMDGNNLTGININIFAPGNWVDTPTSIHAYFASQSCVQSGDKVYALPHTVQSDHYRMGEPSALFVYDLSQSNMLANYSLQLPAMWPCLVIFQEMLWVIGIAVDEDVQIYNMSNNTWSYGQSMNTPRHGSGCVARSQDILVFGGQGI